MILALAILAAVCGLGFAVWFPTTATVLWILLLETSPDAWLAPLTGGYETIIGALKGAGLVIWLILALRRGLRWDRFNPAFAFAAMFLTGIAHGLFPGLGLGDSFRSLIGSAGPFLFGFIKLPAGWVRAVLRTITLGPLFTVGFGLALAAFGLHRAYDAVEGFRLGGSGQPAFLAGFALIAVYAGLLKFVRSGHRGEAALVLLNLLIILATGARMPLLLAVLLGFGVLLQQGRLLLLAAAGAVASLAVLSWSALGFLRVVDLAQLGQAADLSNRDLVWPYFRRAFASSPWTGWGVGAGKVIIPLNSRISTLIGTNAAHDEYLRIGAEGGALGLALLILLVFLWVKHGTAHLPPRECWLVRAIFLAFAVHSATDNTMIATTASIFFLWASAVFANQAQADKAAT